MSEKADVYTFKFTGTLEEISRLCMVVASFTELAEVLMIKLVEKDDRTPTEEKLLQTTIKVMPELIIKDEKIRQTRQAPYHLVVWRHT